MNDYEFTLTFSLPASSLPASSLPASGGNPEAYLDALFEAGCDDAVIGIGGVGSIALDYGRQAESAASAVQGAIAQVQLAIPGSEFLELKPDLVGITDIAELANCSRQNIRKFVTDSKALFPQPSVSGSVPLWHFYEVANWLINNSRVKSKPHPESIEISKIAFEINIAAQRKRFKRSIAEAKADYTPK